MSRCTLRNIFTVFIYAGVAIFLYPYLTGHFSNAILYLVAGIGPPPRSSAASSAASASKATAPTASLHQPRRNRHPHTSHHPTPCP